MKKIVITLVVFLLGISAHADDFSNKVHADSFYHNPDVVFTLGEYTSWGKYCKNLLSYEVTEALKRHRKWIKIASSKYHSDGTKTLINSLHKKITKIFDDGLKKGLKTGKYEARNHKSEFQNQFCKKIWYDFMLEEPT